MKAWLVQVIGDDRFDYIAHGETRAKVKAASLRSAHDAGYNAILWNDLRVTRSPKDDKLPATKSLNTEFPILHEDIGEDGYNDAPGN